MSDTEKTWKDRQDEDFALLNEDGWEVECESPLEIRHADGSFASGYAANVVVSDLKSEHVQRFIEQDMHDCFNAGVNRGVTIAAIITRRDIGEEFPSYQEYMKKFEEDEYIF